MFVFRPIAEPDLPGLVALAQTIDGGLTTLPPDPEFLRERLDDSLRGFSPRVRRPGGESYLFVLEDTVTGELIGTSGITARIGGYEPFYSYEILTERHTHVARGIDQTFSVLHLKETHRGPSEIGSLFLRPNRRHGGLGRLLSLARFLFIARFPSRFDATVIAELRGYIDQEGQSPFWEAVGRHFFAQDFYTADYQSGLGNKEFIADLMPRHPLYVALLAAAVQAAIGKVHHDTQPALALLQAEGFALTNEIDIFDAGPQLRAATVDIRTIRTRATAPLTLLLDQPSPAPRMLVANDQLDFRATLAPVAREPDGIALDRTTADALHLTLGDAVAFSPLASTLPRL
jgi:arginine N-succinyltransferase